MIGLPNMHTYTNHSLQPARNPDNVASRTVPHPLSCKHVLAHIIYKVLTAKFARLCHTSSQAHHIYAYE